MPTFATITGTATGHDGKAITAKVFARPLTTNGLVRYGEGDGLVTVGTIQGSVYPDGSVRGDDGTLGLKIPLETTPVNPWWDFRMEVAGSGGALRNIPLGKAAVVESMDLDDLLQIELTAIDTSIVEDVNAAAALVTAKAAEIDAVAATNDGIMALVAADPNSDFSAVQTATLATAPAARPPHALAGGDEPRGVVCWTYDDGYSSAAPYFALMDARGITGTLFLTRNWVNLGGTNGSWGDTYITQAQVQTIAGNGHEIGTHGLNHESVVNYRDANGSAALGALYDSLADYIEATYTGPDGDPVKVTTGAYPAGASDRRCREIMGRRHDFFRGTKGTGAVDAWNPFDVPAYDVQTVTEAAIKAKIDEAVTNDSLLVLLTHGTGPGATRDTQMAKYAACMDYAASLGVRQVSFGQAMAERTQRRSPGAMDDTSGNAFRRRLRTHRVTVARNDLVAGSAWSEIDLVSNAPYTDTDTGKQYEFRGSGLRVTGTRLELGRQRIFAGTTTTGSARVTLTGLSVDDSVIGIGVTGAGIPADSKVGAWGAGFVDLVDAVGAPALATASATVAVTLAWPTPPVSQFWGRAEFHGGTNPRVYGTATSTGYDIYDLLTGVLSSRLNANGITRSSAGSVNVSAVNGNIELQGARQKFLTAAGASFLAVSATAPSLNSMADGEALFYVDAATQTLKYVTRTAGALTTRTVTMA